ARGDPDHAAAVVARSYDPTDVCAMAILVLAGPTEGIVAARAEGALEVRVVEIESRVHDGDADSGADIARRGCADPLEAFGKDLGVRRAATAPTAARLCDRSHRAIRNHLRARDRERPQRG